MVQIEADVSELIAAAIRMENGGIRVGARVAAIIRKGTTDIQGTAQRNAPVDTGYLRGSIVSQFTGDGRTSEMVGRVTVGADYGVYVEYGTSHMRPQPYLRPAVERHTPAIEQALRKVGESIVD